MRVLYADHTTRVSGAQRSLIELLRGLPDGVEPVLASPRGPLQEAVAADGIQHLPIRATAGSLKLHPIHTSRALYEFAAIARELRRAAHHVGADLMHSNTLQAGIAGGLARRAGVKPLVVHVRDCLPQSRAGRAVRGWIGSTADELIAISRYTADCFGPRASVVIPNAVDLERFDPARIDGGALRTELGISADASVLAVVAQITPWKGQRDAIEALALVRQTHPDAQLLIAGETKFTFAATRYDNVAYLAELEALVAERGLGDAVHFLGERDDAASVMAATDVLLVPSWEEPFGRTIIEAMALGIPVVATNIGGPREIIEDGVDGLLLPPEQPHRWGAEIAVLLAESAKRRSFGERGMAKARREYDRGRHARRVVEVYERLLA